MMMTLPNILTMGRIALVPPFIGLFYLPGDGGAWAAFALFALAAVTDYFDGWLARRLNQTSEFGRILDPIADKLIVAAALVMLAVQHGAPVIPVVAILCRELLISGLREGLAGRLSLPVSRLGKWKTASQMVAIALLLIAPPLASLGALLGQAGEALLWLAAVLSWLSAGLYVRAIARQWATP
ncbi:MAG: CDP-diacylglycerol--glycerol-3-phosphate 3-phosphatidyltransferase [Rhodospirillaceae bacterium]|nr:CDP-diacylglycerol--glycerol-3-phosphate 3-phosphatidyltransferase [Rhodospirillaceae bacterium]MBT3627963.1 CDP-diacylglycerol--glycerol-3-phosphate 3-phosphatidyltransferase [Rhodospirillaceae bacterium]MBT5040237.1 CDP-diacylglycerol--glycerol-3-phosphate 3-phosphatidyltransferase [Rhodospirillaceae bacterium]MBT6828393.1 CDP-diacylglycerol--glycerol-3-phosphate 3-phosphatidyltransferase [Rhodospirillaceae bacterium]